MNDYILPVSSTTWLAVSIGCNVNISLTVAHIQTISSRHQGAIWTLI